MPTYTREQRAAAALELRRRRSHSNPENIEAKPLDEILTHYTEKEQQLFTESRFKAMYGGRAGRKSHAIAEYILARMIQDPSLQVVVIRKYRSAVTYSAQLLLKNKVRDMGWERYFEVMGNNIRRRNGSGFIAYTGMQDHNATSIKSYENFGIAWVEEATEIDQFSLDLLVPTLRAPGAEVLFTWNPDQPTDPVDSMFRVSPPSNAIVIPVSFKDNRFLSDESRQDEQDMLGRDPEKHAWIWLGEYNVHSNAIIFAGKWRVDVVDPSGWDGPYCGLDFGFVVDPTASSRNWRSPDGKQIYIERESYRYGLQIDHIATRLQEDIPGVEKYVVRADSAEQDTIDYLRRHGLPRIVPVEKGQGSVETGVKWLKNHEIIVHPDCINFQEELKRYRLKTNKAGDALDEIVDKDNHLIDQVRYAFQPLIKNTAFGFGLGTARYG